MQKLNRRNFIRSLTALPAMAMAPAMLLQGRNPASSLAENKARIKNDPMETAPNYLSLHKRGELKIRGEILWEKMRSCNLCPRDCGTDRISLQRGDCRASAELEISSASAHFGEEAELVGSRGSGTIFFTNCSLLCVFCINYEISHLGQGRTYGIGHLANMMLLLQRNGCHNINLVTPSHYVPHILLALDQAAARGLRLPVVYNTCGWEKTDVLELLDGVVDIYLADFKYADAQAAGKYSPGAHCYPEVTEKAMIEMHRQVGVAETDPETNLIYKGLMIRHLVMPGNVARSDRVVRWIANNLPKNTYLNIMSQYTPMYKAFNYPEISRHITRSEYNNVVSTARRAGLTNLRLQMQ